MATAIGKRKRATTAKRKTVVVEIGKRRPAARRAPARKKRVSGTAAVGSTRRKATKRRKSVSKSLIGATTGGKNMIVKIGKMALGMGIGLAAGHFILRPVENWLAAKFPALAKFMAVGEIFIGGYIAMKSKNHTIQAAGLGLAAAGVKNAVDQFHVFQRIPGIHGPDEYTRLNVPISGPLDDMINGLLQDSGGAVYTSNIAGGNSTPMMAPMLGDTHISGGSHTSNMTGHYGMRRRSGSHMMPAM